jgi:integrase
MQTESNPTRTTTSPKSNTNRKRRRRREGSIYQRRSDKRWVATYIDQAGRRRSVYAQSHSDVLARLKETIVQADNVSLKTTSTTVSAFLDSWLEDLRPHRRATTIAGYRIQCATIKRVIGNIPLAKLEPGHIQKFINSLCERGLKPSSIRQTITVLRMGLKQAVSRKMLSHNPAVDGITLPRVPKRKVEAMTVEHCRAILSAVAQDRLQALFVTMLHTGLRRGEALGLHWSDVDLDRRLLRVRTSLTWLNGSAAIGTTKTDSSQRTLTLSHSVVAALRAHRLKQNEERLSCGPDYKVSDLVFTDERGNVLSPRSVARCLDALLNEAGLAKMRLHDLRHGCATLLLSQSVDIKTISTILGHSNIRTTCDLYLHVSQQGISDAIDALDQAIGL